MESSVINSTDFSMVGPVHFQPLEQELQQVKEYINDKTLNAGCGNRDITQLLKELGATEVINYDIESNIQGAITGSLANTPFESDTFETIYCNAVLEHVADIDGVFKELIRIAKPGGVLVIGMPFLQPYHQCPSDYRRYTKDGLIELGEIYKIKHIKTLPVHSIAQTLGWILWEWALEKGGIRKKLLYRCIWIMTRISYKTDFNLVNNANTYQVVFKK